MSGIDDPQPDVLAALATGLPPLDPPALVKAQLLDLAEAPRGAIDASRYTWDEPFPGIRICLLKQDPSRGMTGRLVWGKPGAIYPAHRHSGPEATLVLEGAYRDEHGRHGAGDVTRESELTTHAIEILPEGDCFSYIVAYGESEIL